MPVLAPEQLYRQNTSSWANYQETVSKAYLVLVVAP